MNAALTVSDMFFNTKHKNNVNKKVKNLGLIGTVLLKVKSISKLEIQIGDLNQPRIELILFVVVNHPKKKLINSIIPTTMVSYLSCEA